MVNWLGMDLQEMEETFTQLGEERYRGRQLADWIYGKGVLDFAAMSSFSLALREKLAELSQVEVPIVSRLEQSARDPVWKALLQYADGALAECVLMHFNYGSSVCLSSQIGCRQRCIFCASGSAGLERNLSTAEILGQILLLQQLQPDKRVSHIVMMGMGEPLDNLAAVLKALHIANATWGLGISYRQMTVSTCGSQAGIAQLRQQRLPLTLSVSLHAPDDATRRLLMPVAAQLSLKDLLAEIRLYTQETRRRVTLEYVMIDKLNDSLHQAEQLRRLLRGMLVQVNLIPLNPVGSSGAMPLSPSPPAAIRQFTQVLRDGGINVTLRKERGGDITAACGQLRRHQLNNSCG